MKLNKNITAYAAILLLVSLVFTAFAATPDSVITAESSHLKDTSSKNDTSSYIKSILRSFFALEDSRKKIFRFDSMPEFRNPYFIDAASFYRNNCTEFSDALQNHPLFSEVRFGLSGSLNRSLFYGTVAPVTPFQSRFGTEKVPYNLFPVNPSSHFSTEKECLSITNAGINLLDFPVNTAIPEVMLLWENGVFDENILDVRFTRPLTRAIMINVYSNFRYLNGMEYSHDANDIFNFYSNFSDSTKISHKGYNPKVNEHVAGIQLRYLGQKGNSINLNLEYSELIDEIALDTSTSSAEQVYEMYYGYPFKAEIISSANRAAGLFWDLGFSFINEPLKRIQPALLSDSSIVTRNDGSINVFSGFFQTGKAFNKSDSIGINITASEISTCRFDRSDMTSSLTDCRLFYKLNRYNPTDSLSCFINGGVAANSASHDPDSTKLSPVWHAGLDISGIHNKLRLYVKQDNIPRALPFDTSCKASESLLDNYFQGGAEYLLRSGKSSLLLGYQYLTNIDSIVIANAWPSGVLPYKQPHSSIIVAPAFGRWRGLSVNSSVSFSDEKPFIKASARLSYVIHPLSTSEYIDINLGYEYWSKRESVEFAGISDWNEPIHNVDLDVSVHILSFRLFYKVDNILNRKFAYVPGYYSSGLTFRWGFNWFIQR